MKKIVLSATLALLAINSSLCAQEIPGADTRWFEDARFGMFIHFGPYAVLGDGEWVMNTRPIARAEYMQLQDFFNPAAFDAAEWVGTAKAAGMKYMIITSRHHDGFSMWDTAQSEWGIMNTPYGMRLSKRQHFSL